MATPTRTSGGGVVSLQEPMTDFGSMAQNYSIVWGTSFVKSMLRTSFYYAMVTAISNKSIYLVHRPRAEVAYLPQSDALELFHVM